MKPILFDVLSNIVRIGTNSEMCDMDNRDGAIFGFEAIVYLEEADGTRYANTTTYTNRDEMTAQRQADEYIRRIKSAMSHGYVLKPSRWVTIEPRYGSPAYERNGTELNRVREEYNMEFDRL